MERKLASIQRVTSLEPIKDADRIEKATVLGWELVVQKGDFRAGDLCVYCEIDSILPERPEFEFLRPRNFRIKTIKLKKQVSQGIAFPVSILPEGYLDLPVDYEGTDVTEVLGITKYEPNIPAHLAGQRKGNFPGFLRKTDEMRIQAVPRVLQRNVGKKMYVTEKVDGTSVTYFVRDGGVLAEPEFGICSRNIWLKETEENKDVVYIQVAKQLDIETRLKNISEQAKNLCLLPNGNIAIQGEIVGPGVQKNKYHLEKLEFFVFSVYVIDEARYLSYGEFVWFCALMDFRTVPVLFFSTLADDNGNPCEVPPLVENSKGMSQLAKVPREGLVVRSLVEDRDEELGRLSFKIINPDFLLLHGE